MKPFCIIGLTGPAGSGKDTVADILVEQSGFTKMAFADALRSEAACAFRVDVRFFTCRETKEEPMPRLALNCCPDEGFVTRMIVMYRLRKERLDLDAPRSPRQIMQWWGTDYRRHQKNCYWVSVVRDRIEYLTSQRITQRIVVTDVRFADEADLVRRRFAGQLWQIERPGLAALPGGHVSEVSGSQFRPDLLLNNCHTIGHLEARVLEAYGAGLAA